jgi:hypothetical protein
MSVTWRRLGHFVASWIHEDGRNSETAENADAAQNARSDADDTRRAGMARLQAAFSSSQPQQLTANEESPGTHTLVSQ